MDNFELEVPSPRIYKRGGSYVLCFRARTPRKSEIVKIIKYSLVYLLDILTSAQEGLKVIGLAILNGVGGVTSFRGQYFLMFEEICGIHSKMKLPLIYLST